MIIDHRIDFDAPRTVKPRTPKYEHLNVIAVDVNYRVAWCESDDKTRDLDALPVLLLDEPNSLLVGYEIGLVVKEIADAFADSEDIQIKATPIERELTPWNGDSEQRGPVSLVNHGLSFGFIGWRQKDKRKGWKRKHFPIDPETFTASLKREYQPRDRSLEAVIAWAFDLREFLRSNGLGFRPTQSGVAAQLLRDPRFYPEARRKVPRGTNAAIRTRLPGNFYALHSDRRRVYNAVEIDQKNSHHSCARDIAFPNANALYAKGYFTSQKDVPYARAGTRLFERMIRQPGLFYLKLDLSRRTREPFPLPFADYDSLQSFSNGRRTAFVYSNELDELRAQNIRIEYIIAAWTSRDVDEGLNRYARWSLQQLDGASADRRRWLKPLLLSTYGLLATRPRGMRSLYLRGIGLIRHYHVGRGEVMKFIQHESEGEFEPKFANVIHRGMIEAETRLRSLRMARYLQSHGLEVLCIYADAIYVTGTANLPLIPQGWGTRAISNVHFPDSNRVICDEFVKLPGVSGRRRRAIIHEVTGRAENDAESA